MEKIAEFFCFKKYLDFDLRAVQILNNIAPVTWKIRSEHADPEMSLDVSTTFYTVLSFPNPTFPQDLEIIRLYF